MEKNDINIWALSGGVLVGLGAGFFFIRTNTMAFVGCILLGVGLGLMATAWISSQEK